jgi:hypothetical protein
MCMRDSRRDFDLDVGFIDLFNTQLVITLNYSAIVNFRTLQIIRAHEKSFPVLSVFTSRCLVRLQQWLFLCLGAQVLSEWRLSSN